MNCMIPTTSPSGSPLATRLRLARRALKPPPILNLIEWADTYRKVAGKTSASPGQWRTAAQPVSFGPMAAVTEPDTHTISVMAATQVLKTELLINIAGYFIHQDPGSILFVQPTQSNAEAFSKERFQPTVEATPALAGLIPKVRARGSATTIAHKPYPGGSLDFVGSNAPGDLASRPKRIGLFDEVDKYPPSAGDEGDPVALGEERLSTYKAVGRSLSVRTCSPTSKETSRIGREYRASDQRQCFVPCPHCGFRQALRWANVVWSRDASGEHLPDTAAIRCEGPDCGTIWTERERIAALGSLEHLPDYGWRQMRPFTCCEGRQHPTMWTDEGRAVCVHCGQPARYDGHAGFAASKLLSARHRLSDVVREFVAAQGNPELLKKFVNTALAELWEEQAEAIDQNALHVRAAAEGWLAGTLLDGRASPEGVLIVTCGVDVQGDRLEVERVGWGAEDESWSLDHHVIYGDPSAPELWAELDDYLLTATETEDGRELAVAAACIDSGGHSTDAVYRFVRDKARRRVWAIKGQGGPGRPVWPKLASKNNKGRIALFNIGVDAAKDTIYGRFRIEHPGPGYCHFPADRDPGWFEQVTAEKVVTRYAKGFPIRVWEPKPNVRNEALDCRVYAFAALRSMSISWGKVKRIVADQQKARAEMAVVPVPPPAVAAQAMAKPKPAAPPRNRVISRFSMLGR